MKKTLIALAVAASAAVSGSAMAWTANGSGGSVDLGGTLNPVTKATPWEVETGGSVTGLDGQVQKGQKEVSISVKNAIPVLGIRSIKSFKGQGGIAPTIDYHGAIDISKFSNNTTGLTLDVNDAKGQKIGKLNATLSAMGRLSRVGIDNANLTLYAAGDGHAFFGGLSNKINGVNDGDLGLPDRVFPESGALYSGQAVAYTGKGYAHVSNTSATYSAYYGSGIEQGQSIKITLDRAASGDAPIQWKASLPVTVTYM